MDTWRPAAIACPSDHRVKRFEVGILLSQIAEGAVHLEADLQVRLGVVDIAEQSFVTTHVVIIDCLFQQSDGSGDEKVFCFGGFAELMETKPGVKKSGAGIGGNATQLLTYAQGQGPFLFPHQMMGAKLKDFAAVSVAVYGWP